MVDQDQGYKLLFSHPGMVEELLKGFVREDWVKELDFSSLEKLNASYVSDDLRERHDDVVWRVRLAGKWLYVYILLEFQSTVDLHMALRTMVYVGLLYQDLLRTKRVPRNAKLPPVLPIVLYNGEQRWRAPTDIANLIEPIPRALSQYTPHLEYLLIDEGAYSNEELSSLKNLVALLFQLEKTPAKEVSLELVVRLLDWVKEKRDLQRAFAVFLNRVYFKKPVDLEAIYRQAGDASEVTDMLSKNVERWIEEWKAEGEAKGEARGEAKARSEVAIRLLRSGAPIGRVAELTGLSEDDIRSLSDTVTH